MQSRLVTVLSGTRIGPTLDLDFRSGVLDPRITFVRASAKRVPGPAGTLVTYAPRTNLLLRSEEFDNASWDKVLSSVTADTAASPDGALTADTLNDNATLGEHYILLSSTISSNTAYTLSVHAKKGTARYLRLAFFSAFNPTSAESRSAIFDLEAGVVSTAPVAGASASASIVTMANGWFRLVLTATSGGAAISAPAVIQTVNADGVTLSYSGTGLGHFIWGAQLEAASAATGYIPTTSAAVTVQAPAFAWDPVTLAPLGISIEESRTNLVLRSEDFTNTTAWPSLSGTVNRTGDFSVAPDGTTTADLLTFAATGATIAQALTTAIIVGAVYTGSIYVRNASRTGLNLRVARNGAGTYEESLVAIPVSAQWQRLSITHTFANAQTAVRLDIVSVSGGTNATVEVWGAQLEAASFASTYIQTTTTALARAADVCEITGTNFSSWYNPNQGTFVAEFISAGGTLPRVFELQGITKRLLLAHPVASWDNNGTVAAPTINGINAVNKLAVSYSATVGAASANGNAAVSVAITNTTGATSINIGDVAGGTRSLNGTIARLTYYPVAFSANAVQALSR
jgi:hypothetical protein